MIFTETFTEVFLLIFFGLSAVNVTKIKLSKKDENLLSLDLILSLSIDQYQEITTKSLFNFKPEICNSRQGADFDNEYPIDVEVTLQLEKFAIKLVPLLQACF